MHMRARLEVLIDEMIAGRIMLDEALAEFEKLYIQKALAQNKEHLSRTATALGIHRNTLSKRVSLYRAEDKARNPIVAKRGNPKISHVDRKKLAR